MPVSKPRLFPVLIGAVLALVLAVAGGRGVAENFANRPSLNFYGVPGLIDMPSGQSAPNGEFSAVYSRFGGIGRYTLSFQVTPRLSGSFRYSAIQNCFCFGFPVYYDRSFDLRYQVLDEGRYLPSVTIGLQDFVGTGVYSGEYVAATKTIWPNLKVTAGLGWGRLGSFRPLGMPFGVRPVNGVDTGGQPNFGLWFRGNAAPFAGLEWQVNPKLGLKLEYSSDAYKLETRFRNVFERASPFNFGLEYQVSPSLRLGAYYLYGSEAGLTVQYAIDPSKRNGGRGVGGPGPLPVLVRPDPASSPAAWSQDWVSDTGRTAGMRKAIGDTLALDGMQMESLAISGDRVQLRLRNLRYDSEGQAIGRAARVLTRVLPASVEIFEIVPVIDGLATSKIVLRRSDIERFEFTPNGSGGLWSQIEILDAGRLPANAVVNPAIAPRFIWSISPLVRKSLFDPQEPIRADLVVRLAGRFEIKPGLILSGALTQKVVGNLNEARLSNSRLQHVRTDTPLYDRTTNPAIERLTLAWYSRPGRNLYGRVTVGYLERMFGGVSTELLWKPVDSRLGFGVDLNYLGQRDFNQLLTFRNYRVVTGSVSAYYEFGRGYLAQIDVGRYLAGDYGATFSFDREFPNGWRFGAFATLTNVSAADFGEGSFDKGIRVTIPLTWVTGQPSRTAYTNSIRPITRDGGQPVNVDGRLYETVRSYHALGLDAQFGRVFR